MCWTCLGPTRVRSVLQRLLAPKEFLLLLLAGEPYVAHESQQGLRMTLEHPFDCLESYPLPQSRGTSEGYHALDAQLRGVQQEGTAP